jgi:hypothetical protein
MTTPVGGDKVEGIRAFKMPRNRRRVNILELNAWFFLRVSTPLAF